MAFPISRYVPQNQGGVKPILIAIFLIQTRNLMCCSSAISEGSTSSATYLLKIEPFLLLFLGVYHNMLLPWVVRAFCECTNTHRLIVIYDLKLLSLHLLMKTIIFFKKPASWESQFHCFYVESMIQWNLDNWTNLLTSLTWNPSYLSRSSPHLFLLRFPYLS